MPVTSPTRTIEDLEGALPSWLVRRARRQAEVSGLRLDAAIVRVAVETDFFDYHRGRVAFQDDRARELELRRHGLAVHRLCELQINEEPEEVAGDLRDALGPAS